MSRTVTVELLGGPADGFVTEVQVSDEGVWPRLSVEVNAEAVDWEGDPLPPEDAPHRYKAIYLPVRGYGEYYYIGQEQHEQSS